MPHYLLVALIFVLYEACGLLGAKISLQIFRSAYRKSGSGSSTVVFEPCFWAAGVICGPFYLVIGPLLALDMREAGIL